MLLLAQQDYKVPQIARIVLRSEDTVARVLKRFVAGGLDVVPRRSPPGRDANGYVCKRPTWTDASQSGRASGLRGKRLRVEVVLAGSHSHLNLYPCETWSKLICGVNFPLDLPIPAGAAPASRSLRGPDEVQFAFHPTLTRVWCLKGRRGQRLVEAPGDNRHPSMALGWWTGATGGLMAGSHLDGLLMSFATRCAQQWRVRA